MSRTNETLIWGVPEIHDQVYAIANDGRSGEPPLTVGAIGRFTNLVLEIIIKKGIWVVLEPGTSIGLFNPTTGCYDGLMGGVQEGTIDVVAMPVYFPLATENISTSPVLDRDIMAIGSGYRMTEDVHVGDIFTMFAGIPDVLWYVYLGSFLLFLLVTTIGSRILRQMNYPSVWSTVCAFLDQDNFPTTSSFIATLSTVLMIAMFFLMNYGTNCMSTDLVTIDDPIVITSYEDILARNDLIVGLSSVLPEWYSFKGSTKGTIQEKIFEKMVDVPLTPANAMKYSLLAVDQKVVWVGRDTFVQATQVAMLGLSLNEVHNARQLISFDENAKQYVNIFAINKNNDGSVKQKILTETIQRLSEHGFYLKFVDHFHEIILEVLFDEETKRASPSMLRKMSSKIDRMETTIIDIGWDQFKNVLFSEFYLFIVAGVVLLFEKFFVYTSYLLHRSKVEKVKRRTRIKIIVTHCGKN